MQAEMQTALILISLFLFRPALFAQKNCRVAAGVVVMIILMINFQIYKTHIKPIKPPKPTLIKPVKPAGLGFMIKPGFYAKLNAMGQHMSFWQLSHLPSLLTYTPK